LEVEMVSGRVLPEIIEFSQSVEPTYEVSLEVFEEVGVRVIKSPAPENEIDVSARKIYRESSGDGLVADFSKVRNEGDLKKFCELYGEVGYRTQRDAMPVGGDPVNWCLKHARIVEGLLNVMAIVQSIRGGHYQLDDVSAPQIAGLLKRAFNSFGIQGPHRVRDFTGAPSEWNMSFFEYNNPSAFTEGAETWSAPVKNWAEDPLNGALIITGYLVDPMISGIYPQFLKGWARRGGSPLGLQLVCPSLIGAIYWKLVESMAGTYRTCEDCHRMFPATGKKQFCSPSCMNKAKCRRYRGAQKILKGEL
jgi:hypothetical protein